MPFCLYVKKAEQGKGAGKTAHKGQSGQLAHKPTKHDEQNMSVPMKPLAPSEEVVNYTRKQALQLGAKMGKPMEYDDADRNKANASGDNENCQSSVVAFHARLLGMEVTAKPYNDGGEFVKLLEEEQTLAYYTDTVKKIHPTPSRKLMSADEVTEYIEKETAKNGVYNLAINKYKDSKDGHIMCLIKVDGEAYLVDIQTGKRESLAWQLSKADFSTIEGESIGVDLLRVDKLVLSDEALQVLMPI